MAELNVFELTNQVLRQSDAKKTEKKSVKESVSKKKISKKLSNIPLNKIKLESVSMFKEAEGEEEVDVTLDYTPDDDIVLVVDPDMDEVPEDTEEAVEAAEDLIGDHICKCAICGANYVTDEELTEDLEVEDAVCPVCGEEGEQIVVGVITATDEVSDEDSAELDDVDTEEAEEEEVEDVSDDEDEEVFDDETFEEEEEEDFGESVKRARMRSAKRRAESVAKRPIRRTLAKKTVAKKSASMEEDCSFDDMTLNRMLTRFAKENYSNIKSVRISKGVVRGKTLTLEGVVTTTKGSKRSIKFVSENFDESTRMSLKFKEYGPFTESVKTNRPTFIIECVKRNGIIVPTVLRYNFNTKDYGMKNESRSTYSVTGRVLSEDVNRRK